MNGRRLQLVILQTLVIGTFNIVLASAPAATAQAAGCTGYVVLPGDTLFRIGLKLNVDWKTLAQANGVSPARLQAGQCLAVPGAAGAPASTTPTAQPPAALPQARALTPGNKGIALLDWGHMGDVDRLGAAWYYGWGEYCKADGRCINMVRSMQMPIACYDRLLVGNEPNAREPFGHPVDPGSAAADVMAIEARCPNTKLIAGNVSADDWNQAGGWGSGADWLEAFLAAYQIQAGRPYAQTLGVHCYSTAGADYCIDRLAALRRLYSGEMWVTEFNIQRSDGTQFARLLSAINTDGYAAYAVYTNRNNGAAYDQPGTAMVLGDESLSSNGQVYASWK